MGVVPGKRETMKDRFIKVLRNECNESDGYIMIDLVNGKDNHSYKILYVYQSKQIERFVMKKYDDDLFNIKNKKIRLVSLLYVDGKHSIEEILYGLSLNEDYIFTG